MDLISSILQMTEKTSKKKKTWREIYDDEPRKEISSAGDRFYEITISYSAKQSINRRAPAKGNLDYPE